MIIPWQQLNQETLTNLLESFVLREGTDYGSEELSFAEKVSALRAQLESGHIVVVYSELHESVNLMSIQDFKAQQSSSMK
ncbi:YheU family protein [Celerinatantimonas yamalensis]|uniref:YheU family protein n=1 Tax=Celerinatantimonas yamalensis TaxID=559956 RepID=A0ABW9G853_9GAMM